jgi:LysW-gamma-L-alpha-aminoadipyl-6-phosphate/LysW-L-glutamyl-5-phosphate reductase
MQDLSVAVLGASGFGGGELLRLLASHPKVHKIQAIAHSQAGKAICGVHPHLRGRFDGAFAAELDGHALDVLFAALPHGEFCKRWPALRAQLDPKTLVIDLSGDFRLHSAERFALAYQGTHPCPEFLSEFHYGLSEFKPERLRSAKRIANPGCFATALALALLPWAQRAQAASLHFAISAVTGSSGSGAQPSEGTHHPTRAHDFRAYKTFAHQHEHEVHQLLQQAGCDLAFSLIPHSAPMVRGIYLSAQLRLPEAMHFDVLAHYLAYYREQYFVRVMPEGVARTAATVGSNFCDISIVQKGQDVAILLSLDNLLKGMAGQAVQNMNIALGFAEFLGLQQLGLYP